MRAIEVMVRATPKNKDAISNIIKSHEDVIDVDQYAERCASMK
jgi:hypothetical protein